MRIAIIDDSGEDRALLRSYAGRWFETETLELAEFSDGESFLREYRPGSYDLLLIDLYMKRIGGMELARSVRAAGDSCTLIFVTSSPDGAVDGYLVRAAGYLLKPFTYERFAETMRLSCAAQALPFVELPLGEGGTKLLLSHIQWCETRGHYVCVHTTGQGELNVRLPFRDLAALLAPYSRFYVCYRGCMVNFDHVCKIAGCDFLLLDGQHVPIAQREISGATRALAEYQFKKLRGEPV